MPEARWSAPHPIPCGERVEDEVLLID